MTLGFAQPSDETSIRALLKSAHLPTDDLTPEHLRHFIVMKEQNNIIGVAGVERLGRHSGLIRSIAVESQFRGQGVAGKLYRAVEEHACSMGLREVFAMTTTIEAWLGRLGFTRLQRDNAPEDLRKTSEFTSLCPSSAAILQKTLQVASKQLPGTFECA